MRQLLQHTTEELSVFFFANNTNEWHGCEHRIVALKDILVSLYGTTGSFWNRFPNVVAFEEINRLSREALIKTKDIVQGLGYCGRKVIV